MYKFRLSQIKTKQNSNLKQNEANNASTEQICQSRVSLQRDSDTFWREKRKKEEERSCLKLVKLTSL